MTGKYGQEPRPPQIRGGQKEGSSGERRSPEWCFSSLAAFTQQVPTTGVPMTYLKPTASKKSKTKKKSSPLIFYPQKRDL